ncbi:hypothetical protein [Oceanicaulis sp. MMSF_3324]|uniref:hypothetical protein n=1 Tax=Oceanicaulis sp. MMSF_3324 TaxID=3046702 RepID=UPI00273DCCBF|nr:hypothetical protein [Oceanicaulis sp. MMSF_3324]
MKGILLALLVMGALLAGSVWVSVYIWTSMDGGEIAFAMSWHGWLALTLGVVLTAALGVGLMALVFHSSRSGHDDLDDDV